MWAGTSAILEMLNVTWHPIDEYWNVTHTCLWKKMFPHRWGWRYTPPHWRQVSHVEVGVWSAHLRGGTHRNVIAVNGSSFYPPPPLGLPSSLIVPSVTLSLVCNAHAQLPFWVPAWAWSQVCGHRVQKWRVYKSWLHSGQTLLSKYLWNNFSIDISHNMELGMSKTCTF